MPRGVFTPNTPPQHEDPMVFWWGVYALVLGRAHVWCPEEYLRRTPPRSMKTRWFLVGHLRVCPWQGTCSVHPRVFTPKTPPQHEDPMVFWWGICSFVLGRAHVLCPGEYLRRTPPRSMKNRWCLVWHPYMCPWQGSCSVPRRVFTPNTPPQHEEPMVFGVASVRVPSAGPMFCAPGSIYAEHPPAA